MRIACLGYGVDEKRTEAVSINSLRFIAECKRLGHTVYLINVGYPSSITFGKSMLDALLHQQEVVSDIAKFLSDKRIEVVVDIFVLPLSSWLFTLPLIGRLPNVRFIKEVHNPPGFSKHFHWESLIRLFANNDLVFNQVTTSFSSVFTRNKYVANRFSFEYLPSVVAVKSLPKFSQKGRIKIAYLGHPLPKKGVHEFVELFEILPKQFIPKVEFHFAFSDIGPKSLWENKIRMAAEKKSIRVTFHGTVKPWQFFRRMDMYILPIHDDYGAISTPNTVLEAMEAGAVVIATNINSLRGIIETNINGILLDNYRANYILSALEGILYDELLLNRLRKAARRTIIKNHAHQRMSSALRNLLWQKNQLNK